MFQVPPELRQRLAQTSLNKKGHGGDWIVRSAKEDLAELIWAAELIPGDSILDLGCSYGRLALAVAGSPFNYLGVDVSAKRLALAQSLFQGYLHCAFQHLDLHNERYNRQGRREPFHLEIEDGYFRAACAISLFTHIAEDVAVCQYLTELRRLLHPDGGMITTWMTELPSSYQESSDCRAVFTREKIGDMLQETGFSASILSGTGSESSHLRVLSRPRSTSAR